MIRCLDASRCASTPHIRPAPASATGKRISPEVSRLKMVADYVSDTSGFPLCCLVFKTPIHYFPATCSNAWPTSWTPVLLSGALLGIFLYRNIFFCLRIIHLCFLHIYCVIGYRRNILRLHERIINYTSGKLRVPSSCCDHFSVWLLRQILLLCGISVRSLISAGNLHFWPSIILIGRLFCYWVDLFNLLFLLDQSEMIWIPFSTFYMAVNFSARR